MSSLSSILNPEDGFSMPPRRKPQVRAATEEPPSPTFSPPPIGCDSMEPVHYMHDDVPPEHPFHPDCPDTLDCLPNTDGRPQHTLPVILRCVILGSPKKRLTIREIYAAMEEKYPYYKSAGPTWKQSVRHHLSLNRLFERQPRPVTDPGFGSYWTVNLTAPPGTKRPRKRGRPHRDSPEDSIPPIPPPPPPPPPPKPRGRPRKSLPDLEQPRLPPIATLAFGASGALRTCQISAARSGGDHCGEEDEEDMISGNSDDEYESEEDMVYPFPPRQSLTARSPFMTSDFPVTIPPLVPASFSPNAGDNLVDRLKGRIEELRHELELANSRLTDQIAEAHANASRARASQRAVELMLEEERKKRVEAERMASEVLGLRRIAEDRPRHERTRRSRSRSP